MFTDKENVLELIALLRKHGIKHLVLCPGSRNLALIQGFCQAETFNIHPVTDERSAGFYALGIIAAENEPCAVVVTSGSALLNLHPAVAEAHYQKLPLLVISADRPQAWIDQMDGQTIHQPFVFKDLTIYSANLPEIKDEETAWQCNRVINEAILFLNGPTLGPVHLNVPISEPFFDFPVEQLPQPRTIFEYEVELLPKIVAKYKRPWLILGQNSRGPYLSEDDINQLTERFYIFAEHLANVGDENIPGNTDLVLSLLNRDQKELIAPDCVISFGGHIVSKQLKHFLRGIPVHHYQISPEKNLVDLFKKLVGKITCSPEIALHYLKTCPINIEGLYDIHHYSAEIKNIVDQTVIQGWNQLSVLRCVMDYLPDRCTVHLANSSTVRYAQLFSGGSNEIRYRCNRGVNGIEGSLSEAVGAALSTPNEKHVLLIGDLSFFYDMNALGISGLPSNLLIVLFNNHGGEIFALLPGLKLDPQSDAVVKATHNLSARGWARDCGAQYQMVTDLESLRIALERFSNSPDGAALLECSTEQDYDVKVFRAFMSDIRAKFVNQNI